MKSKAINSDIELANHRSGAVSWHAAHHCAHIHNRRSNRQQRAAQGTQAIMAYDCVSSASGDGGTLGDSDSEEDGLFMNHVFGADLHSNVEDYLAILGRISPNHRQNFGEGVANMESEPFPADCDPRPPNLRHSNRRKRFEILKKKKKTKVCFIHGQCAVISAVGGGRIWQGGEGANSAGLEQQGMG